MTSKELSGRLGIGQATDEYLSEAVIWLQDWSPDEED